MGITGGGQFQMVLMETNRRHMEAMRGDGLVRGELLVLIQK